MREPSHGIETKFKFQSGFGYDVVMNLFVVFVYCILVSLARGFDYDTTGQDCKERSAIFEGEFGKRLEVLLISSTRPDNDTYLVTEEIQGPDGMSLCSMLSHSLFGDPYDESFAGFNEDCRSYVFSACPSTKMTLRELKRDSIGRFKLIRTYKFKNSHKNQTESFPFEIHGIEYVQRYHNKSVELKEGEYFIVVFNKSSPERRSCKLIKNETNEEYDLDAESYKFPENNTKIEWLADCGFRMLIDNTSEGNWTLQSEYGWIKRRASFEILINPSIIRKESKLFPYHQFWYDDFVANGIFGPGRAYLWYDNFVANGILGLGGAYQYVEFEKPDGKLLRSYLWDRSSIDIRHITKNDEGIWKLRVKFNNETNLREQNFHVTVDDLPAYIYSRDHNKLVNDTSIDQLLIENIEEGNDSQICRPEYGLLDTFYVQHEDFRIFMDNFKSERHEIISDERDIPCVFDIKNLNDLEGVLVMGRDEFQINDTHYELSPVWWAFRPNYRGMIGESLELKCIASRALSKCTLVSPNGTSYIGGNSPLLVEKKCPRSEGICGYIANIEDAKTAHTGNWTCKMTLKGNRRIKSVIPIVVEEYFLITQYEYNRDGDLTLHCRIPDTKLYTRLRTCKLFNPNGTLISYENPCSNEYDFITIIKASEKKVPGIWKCAVRLNQYIKEEVYGHLNISQISSDAIDLYPEQAISQSPASTEDVEEIPGDGAGKPLESTQSTITQTSVGPALTQYDEKKGDGGGKLSTNPGNQHLLLVILMLILISSLGILICYNFTRKTSLTGLSETKAGPLNPEEMLHEQVDFLPYDKKRWEYPERNLTMGKRLGNGFFGIVVKAMAPNILKDGKDTVVAVKMLQAGENYPIDHRTLEIELKILANLQNHPNIVNLLGACTEKAAIRGLLVILEFCQLGNLLEYMKQNKSKFIDLIDPRTRMINPSKSNLYFGEGLSFNNIFSTTDLLIWIHQTANGMEYLSKKNVLHGDLAARNILLTGKRVAKICDFGLARTLPGCHYYEQFSAALPLRWMAIESVTDRKFSTQSDVWSFGVLLWECFTLGKTPHEGVDALKVVALLTNGERLEMPMYATHEIYEIMCRCWNRLPGDRPSFGDLVQDIGGIKDEIMEQCSMRGEIIYENVHNE